MVRALARLVGASAMALVCATFAAADTIDLSLNVFFENATDMTSGGTWELVGKSDREGIFGLDVFLENVSAPQAAGPLGIVNGFQTAGFGVFASVNGPNNSTNIILGQRALDSNELGSGEQGVFYGVGTLESGAPGDIGPAFSTLSNTSNIPWATGDVFGDAAWDTAVRFATGTFADGVIPRFFTQSPGPARGTVLTGLGTSTTTNFNSLVSEAASTAITTTRRTNFVVPFPDYNDNGVVDAADYTVWKDSFGSTTDLDADGDGNMIINQIDYDVWAANFGQTTPGSGLGAGVGVPEPASLILLGWGFLSVALRRSPPAFAQVSFSRKNVTTA